MDGMQSIGLVFTLVAIALLIIGGVLAKLYRRTSKGVSFVKTGWGGQKVIMDGGIILIPRFQDITEVGMNTLKLEVQRKDERSLGTKDRMRVNVIATFFVRVKQDVESISIAAQTLGARTKDQTALMALVEDKFVQALRSAAVKMTMMDLQDKREEFILAVQKAVDDDLNKNGLELESVALTSLEQTAKEHFDKDNIFDAEGLTLITQQTENRRKERNEIERNTEVHVQQTIHDTTKKQLSITRDTAYATLEQEREIANSKAEQMALIAQTEAQRTREAEEARIEAARQVKEAGIAADRKVELAEIAKKFEIDSRNIETTAQAEVLAAQQRRAVENAAQDANIAIAQKSRDQSQAAAEADQARALAVKEAQEVITVERVAVAQRDKTIALVEAERLAQEKAIGIKEEAKAEYEAAENKAKAITIVADAEKEAALARAAGERAIFDSRNSVEQKILDQEVAMARLAALPSVLREAVAPMAKIDSIKIVDMPGFGTSGMPGAAGSTRGTTGSSLSDEVVSAALRMKAHGPLITQLMVDAGFAGSEVSDMVAAACGGTSPQTNASSLNSGSRPNAEASTMSAE